MQKSTDIDWDDLQVVKAVCEHGSLSAAARKLGVNHSTVFRRINQFEAKIGVRLFDRQSHGYEMTEAGEAVFATGGKVDDLVHNLMRKISGKDLSLSGTLRVAVPDALLLKILMPPVAQFSSRHPKINLEMVADNSYADLNRREADMAVRVSRSPSDTLFGRRICDMATALYCHEDIAERQAALMKSGDASWLVPDNSIYPCPARDWIDHKHPNATIALTSNSLLYLVSAAQERLGIAPLPCFLGDGEAGLVRVSAPIPALSSQVWVLTHPDLKGMARVRSFMDHIGTAITAAKDQLEGAL